MFLLMMARTGMTPTPRPNGTPPFVVELTEWDQVGPARDSRLKGRSLASDMQSRRLAETLRERLDIREGYEGLEITSTSFVGRVDVGPLRIAVGPKLPAMPLARLLGYAYGLRDVADHTSHAVVSSKVTRRFV
jgi:5-methylcytosine-specific restriction enzyme subunit McrC